MDVAGFLAKHPPFDALSADQLAPIAAAIRVEFFPAGTVILEQAGEPAAFLYVIRKGAVELLDHDRLTDLLDEGESFGHLSLLSGLEPTSGVRAHEDTLCYLIPRHVAEGILGTSAGVAFMASVVRRRLGADARAAPPEGIEMRSLVGSLVRRSLITARPEATAAKVARLMTDHRVSSLLVASGEGWGIVTDRDLRSRILAAGLGPETPVTAFMTSPVRTVPSDAPVGDVLLSMLEHGVHHLPVTDGSGTVIGIVTDTDLLGLARQSPFALKSAIERAPDEGAAASAARSLPLTVCALVDASVDPVEVGHVVGLTIDTLTRRLLELATADLGEPPAPWAWLALGSEARHEQALHTDQDHALVVDPGDREMQEVDPYFAELATRVTAGLESAGISRCRGDAMAENPAMRRSLQGWVDAFHGWMNDAGIGGSILSSIAFDYRRLAGPLDPEPELDRVVGMAPDRYPQFLRHLARRALDLHPPTGFFRDLVVEAKGEHAGRLDIKHGGITIVTNLARAYTVRAGRTEKRTLDRLRGAVESGQIDDGARAALEETFRLLWSIRLEHQAGQVRAGAPPDDFVDPRALGPIRRRALREAFRIIVREQRALATELGVRMRTP